MCKGPWPWPPANTCTAPHAPGADSEGSNTSKLGKHMPEHGKPGTEWFYLLYFSPLPKTVRLHSKASLQNLVPYFVTNFFSEIKHQDPMMRVHYLATCVIRTYQLTQVRLPFFCLETQSWRNTPAVAAVCLFCLPHCLPLWGNKSHLCWEFSVCVCPVQTPKGMVSLTDNKAIHRPLAVQVHMPTQLTTNVQISVQGWNMKKIQDMSPPQITNLILTGPK